MAGVRNNAATRTALDVAIGLKLHTAGCGIPFLKDGQVTGFL